MGTTGPDRGIVDGQRYFTLGLKFAAGIVFFVILGVWLDRRFGVTPLFTILGTIGGTALSAVSVYRDVGAPSRPRRRSGPRPLRRTLGIGLLLTFGVAAVLAAVYGRSALPGAVGFGLLATGIQAGARRALRGAQDLPFAAFLRRWAVGMGLRLAGVAVFAGLVAWDGERFRPIPSAVGYLGVLIPLLFLERRLAR